MELLGTKYSLQRTDVPALLKMVGYDDNLAFVEHLILGDWTPEPPQCLRRFSTEIIESVDAAGGGGAGGLSERCLENSPCFGMCLFHCFQVQLDREGSSQRPPLQSIE